SIAVGRLVAASRIVASVIGTRPHSVRINAPSGPGTAVAREISGYPPHATATIAMQRNSVFMRSCVSPTEREVARNARGAHYARRSAVMSQDVELRCRCGEVHGWLSGAAPDRVNRVVCYCDDCQAFLHQLDRSDLLDAHGGTDIVQVAPAALRFDRGMQHIAGL